MKLHDAIRNAAGCAVVVFLLAQPLSAQFRTWVSHNGNDHNNCSLDSPCRTFQRAHDVMPGFGEVDVVDPGDYGAVSITHPIVIDGGNMGYITTNYQGVLVNSGDTFTTFTSGVILRNLSINTSFNGANQAIGWIGGRALRVENVSIDGSFDSGVAIFQQYTSILANATQRRLYIENTRMDCLAPIFVGPVTSSGPLSFPVPLYITIEHSSLRTPGQGATGLTLQFGTIHVIDTTITGFQTAIQVSGTSELNLENSSITDGGIGIEADGVSVDVGPNALVRLAGNNIHHNGTALLATGGARILSYGTNHIDGNLGGETPTGSVALK